MEIDGRFWFSKNGENFLGNGRIELLEQIEKSGSINAASKAMKMSYKAAWERINQMNRLSDTPIITKLTGGKGGGGTVLTPHAYELIKTYKRFRELHTQFMERFAEAGDDPQRLENILNRTFLTTSARNQLVCKIISVEETGINGSLNLQLKGGESLCSDITMKSIKSMGLSVDSTAYAIIKSNDVFVSLEKPENREKLNILDAKVTNKETQDEVTELTLELKGSQNLISVMSKNASNSLEIDMQVFACVEKQHIILGL